MEKYYICEYRIIKKENKRDGFFFKAKNFAEAMKIISRWIKPITTEAEIIAIREA